MHSKKWTKCCTYFFKSYFKTNNYILKQNLKKLLNIVNELRSNK